MFRGIWARKSGGLVFAIAMAAVVGCSGAVQTAGSDRLHGAGRGVFAADLRRVYAGRRASSCGRSTIRNRRRRLGWLQAILAERDRPRCDLFWNNEILNTLRLEREGLLRAYAVAGGQALSGVGPLAEGDWYGFAARALCSSLIRISCPSRGDRSRFNDLIDPQWYESVGIAKPLFGTTATHAACLAAVWGEEKTQEFFRAVKRNARIDVGQQAGGAGGGVWRIGFRTNGYG